MNFTSAPDRHKWLSNSSLLVAAKLATSFRPKWKAVKLGDIAQRISTGTTPPSKVSRYYGGATNWFTPSDIGGRRWLSNASKTVTEDAVNEKKARLFETETILITCIGQIGRVGILSQESSSNQQITGIKFLPKIDAEFAYYGLFARQDELQAAAPTASTLPILNQTRLSNIDFCFPEISEQKQIGKFLSWCEDRLIAGQPFTDDFPQLPDYLSDLPHIVARIEALAERINEALLIRLKSSDETISILPSIVSNLDEKLRTHSELISLEMLAAQHKGALRSGPFGSSLLHSEFVDEGIPAIGIEDVRENYFFPSGRWKVSKEKAKELQRYRIMPGDLLITVMGTLGRTCCVPQEIPYMISTKHIWTITLDPKKAFGPWVSYWLNYSRIVRSELLGQTTGTAIGGLNGQKIRRVRFPLISIVEQHRIVAYLDSLSERVNELRRLQAESQVELDALLPSILDKAFKGEL